MDRVPNMPDRAFRELAVDTIHSKDMDLREDVDEGQLDGLGSTMKDFGTLSPILVAHDSHTKQYSLIFGGRRLRAAKRVGLPTIPAFIVDDLSERHALMTMLIENMQRTDLKPLEESRGMAELRDRFNFTEAEIAGAIGQRVQFVHERLALLDLPDSVQQHIAKGKLGVSQAVSLLKLEGNEEKQVTLAEKAVERNLSGEIVARIVEEETRTKRRYKKITRKHKLKKEGGMLSEDHMDEKLRQTVLRGEQLLNLLDSLPIKRWSPERTGKLHQAVEAIEQGLIKFRRRIRQRAKEG